MLVLIIIGGLLLGYFIIGILLPSKTTFIGSVQMTGTPEIIMDNITNFEMWKEWSIWNKDNSMKIQLSNPAKGINARYRWKPKIKEIKSGLLKIREIEYPHFCRIDFYYGRAKRGDVHFNILPSIDHSLVTCSITINNRNRIFSRYFAQYIRKEATKNIEEMLLLIDSVSGYQKGIKPEE